MGAPYQRDEIAHRTPDYGTDSFPDPPPKCHNCDDKPRPLTGLCWPCTREYLDAGYNLFDLYL